MVLFYDNNCSLCSRWVRFVNKHSRIIKVLPLNSKEAKLELQYLFPEYLSINSIVLLEGKKLFLKSDAILKVCSKLNGFWPLLLIFSYIPSPFRNFLYDKFAKNRYRWFGKTSCSISEMT
jgi:predicted DCC family thiol-disulfide oxidoreductase YuxK